MQKASKGNRDLARHQLNPTRQGDHPQMLPRAPAKRQQIRNAVASMADKMWKLADTGLW